MKTQSNENVSFVSSISTGFLIFALLLMPLARIKAQTRGVAVKVKTTDGQTKEVKLYDGSFALVIGESSYTNGWDNLPGVKTDVAQIKQSLSRNGFQVESEINLTSEQLKDRIERFISDYGYLKNYRLLIYFAGHGHTQKSADGRDLGYIIPVDTPLPEKDDIGFRRKAISMDTIQNYARQIEAKHALFIFDSCFSGKLVSREKVTIPPVIQENVSYPVRQFITAGAANQPVPDDSIFRKVFVRGLEGEADRNSDGYITGSELADFLKEKVTNSSDRTQTPQYGKIRDLDLERGDFVFVVSKNQNNNNTVQNQTPIIPKDRATQELEAWNLVRNSSDAQDFRNFLGEFPGGANAGNAKIKLEQAVWDSVKSSSEATQVKAYLEEFPAGANASSGRILYSQLTPKCTPPPSGIVSWYSADYNANDTFGTNHGAISGGPAFASGKVGQAFSFNGINQFVTVPDSANMQPIAFTIEGWVNFSSLSRGAIVASKYDGNWHGWLLQSLEDGNFQFQIARSANVQKAASGSVGPIAPNTWVHVAGTYDGTNITLYINGSVAGTAVFSGGYTPTSAPMTIGKASWYNGDFLPGKIDELKFFNRALSASEIVAIAKSGSLGICH